MSVSLKSQWKLVKDEKDSDFIILRITTVQIYSSTLKIDEHTVQYYNHSRKITTFSVNLGTCDDGCIVRAALYDFSL